MHIIDSSVVKYYTTATIFEYINKRVTWIKSGVFNVNLTSINLEENYIKILPKQAFSELVNLKTLNLRSNCLQNINACAFKDLQNLIYLNLAENSISVCKLPYLENIKVIDMCSNELTDIDKSFSKLTRLRTIILQHNKLMSLDNLPKYIEYLFVAFNKIKSFDAHQFPFLHLILISENQITSLNISQHYHLQEVDISSNLLTSAYIDETNIQVLFMSHNRLGNITITNSNDLHRLSISNNMLTSIDFIHNLPSVKRLDIANNRFDQILQSDFKHKLEYICLTNAQNITLLDLCAQVISNNSTVNSMIGRKYILINDKLNTIAKNVANTYAF